MIPRAEGHEQEAQKQEAECAGGVATMEKETEDKLTMWMSFTICSDQI